MTPLTKSMARIRWPPALVAVVGGVLLSIAVSWICLWFSPCSTAHMNIERADGRIRGWTVDLRDASARIVDLKPHQAAWPISVPHDWSREPATLAITRGVGVECISGGGSKTEPQPRRLAPGIYVGRTVAATSVRWGWPATMFESGAVTSVNVRPPSAISRILPDPFMERPASWVSKNQGDRSFRIVWTGVVVNSAVFAVLIALMSAAVRIGVCAARRRRGCCTRCGYKVDGARCPECGHTASRTTSSRAWLWPPSASDG